MQLKFGELTARHLCDHNSLATIVSAALGGSTEEPGPRGGQSTSTAISAEAAVAEMNAAFRGSA